MLFMATVLTVLLGVSYDEPKLVSFPTSDGGVVFANRFGEGDHAVILAHGGRFTKENWTDQALKLKDAGFQVLAIDFRGRGRSRAGSEPEGYYLDVLAAVRYLRSAGAHTVSVVGASFGGGAAAQAAVQARPGEIDGLVLLAHSPIPNPEKMKGRKLFIITRDDSRGEGIPRLPEFRQQFEEAPGPKDLVILEGSAHAQFIFETDQAERLMHEIVEFLSAPNR